MNVQTNSGIYSLILHLKQNMVIRTGSLGKMHYSKGYYVYTGSARGKSGFSRIQRHINVAKGINKTRHWHIDYLLPNTTLKAVITLNTAENLECRISNQIKTTTSIKNFGSTDCKCTSHLQYHTNFNNLLNCTLNAYRIYTNNVNLHLLK
jgi:endonuclease-3